LKSIIIKHNQITLLAIQSSQLLIFPSSQFITTNSKMPCPSKFENVSGVSDRKQIEYTPEQIALLQKFRKSLELEFRKLAGDEATKIHENQTKIAKQVLDNFKNSSIINHMVISPTQSGKTGIICETIRYFINDTDIPYKNIYILTGLSSVEWKVQTKNRLPEKISERVFHRNDLNDTFYEDIKKKKNVLIILDEIQIASAKDQTLHKVFENLGYMDLKILLEKSIKFIEVTATPNGSIYDLMKWGEKYASKIIVEPPTKYTSCFKLFEQGRVKQYENLCDDENSIDHIKELKQTIESNYKTPRFHFIRTKPAEFQDVTEYNFKKVFGDDCKVIDFDFKSEEDDVNNIIKEQPSEHTFIFIKEKLRCAKTIENKHLVGVYYERWTKSRPEDDVIIQGMLGRATGYNDNGDSIVYTNIESIEKYKELITSNFENMTIKWASSSTTFKNNKIRTTGYYNTPENIKGFKAVEFENDTETPEEKRARIDTQKKEKEIKKQERKKVKEEKQKIKEQKQKEKEEKKKMRDEIKQQKQKEKEEKKENKNKKESNEKKKEDKEEKKEKKDKEKMKEKKDKKEKKQKVVKDKGDKENNEKSENIIDNIENEILNNIENELIPEVQAPKRKKLKKIN